MRYDANEVEKMYAYMRGEIAKLKECLADMFDLRENVTDDLDLIEIGKHPETGEWRVWHQHYPDEGSMPLDGSASPPDDRGSDTGEGA